MDIKDPETAPTDIRVPETANLSQEQIQRQQATSTAPTAWPIDYELDETTLTATLRTDC